MADVNANIGINLETSAALAQLKDLQRQLAIFNTSISKTSASAVAGQKKLATNLVNSINDTGKFVAEIRGIDSTVESFTKNLEKNKFSVKEYFRFAGATTKTFGKNFKGEFDTINKVAEDRVKRLSTQYIKLGRDATGTMQAISVMPKSLDMSSYSTQMQISAQRQALFNQLVKQGSTGLINFGKNTQWAGRQLMVGFTIPLMILGSTASKTFLQMEEAAINFRKVYGDLFTPTAEREQALQDITELGKMFTKYGIAVSETVALAADAAAAGFAGLDLQRQTTEATRLSVLGQIDTQKALTTTIALQNAFKISSEEMADSINFLNAVENQTVLSLDDVTEAIPRVGPIIEQLGGNVKDLAFFLTAMKEGGVSAAQGANALKSGLASLIAPSDKAAAALMDYGININKIVEGNQGNLRQTVVDFAAALDTLDPLNRSRAIEQLFGKFQFARLSALFNNITTDGTQASRVLDLAGASIEELAGIAESELAVVSDATGTKFKKAMEDLKLALIPVGEEFLKAATPIVEFVSGILERFNNLSDGSKKAFTLIIAAVGGLAPVILMSFGLLNNLIGNAIKFALTLRQGYLKLTGQSNILSQQTNYLTLEQTEAMAAAHSLNQSHAGLTQVFNVEREAIMQLIAAYQTGTKAAQNFANVNRNFMGPGFNPNMFGPSPKTYNKGVVMVPGSGNKDTIPAMLTPGEAVIPSKMAKKYAPLIQGMIAGNIPGYKLGKTGSGRFGVSVSTAKDTSELYRAPRTIKPQTMATSWSTMQAEIDAMTAAAETYLKELGFNSKKITQNIRNLVQKQASHITQEIKQIEIAGETIDVKQWNASNLIADFGGINNYLNSIHKVTETLDEQEISKLASNLNMSIDEFKSELKMLADGIHPTTRKAGQVLGAVAKRGSNSTDKTLAYQSRAVSAGMETRLAGDFYETISDRAYDPTKDLKSLEQVELKIIKFKQQILDSFNISDEIAGLSGKNVQSLNSAWSQLSIQAKERLVSLSGDVNAFTAALMQEAREAGIAGFEVGNESIKGISRGSGTASPSSKTIKIGQDVAKGLEIGMQQGKSGVTRAGNQLRDAAVTSSGLIIPGSAVGSGALASGGAGGIIPPKTTNPGPADDENRARQQNTKAIMSGTDKMQNLNKLMMTGSFAITGLAGAGSFAGGKLGEFSNGLFKVSGLLFGLQAVIQLLTDQMLTQLVAGRFRKAQVAARGAGIFGSGLASRGGILGSLAKVGIRIAKFLGPWGALTAAVASAYAVWSIVKKQREQERESIESLGNAAKLTAEQVKTLGNFFGVVPQALPSELSGDLFVTGPQERTQLEALKENEEFKEQFKKTIQTLKSSTNSQIELTLQTLGLELSARGFANEQIDLIVKAIQEKAGKTDLAIEFKSFDIDNYMKNLNKLSNRFQNQIEKQSQRTTGTREWVRNAENELISIEKFLKPTKEYEKFANAFGTNFANAFDGISGQVRNGVIDVEQYKKQIGKLTNSFEDLDQAAKQVAISKMLKDQDKKTRDAIEAVKNEKHQILLLTAAYLGLNVAKEAAILAQPVNDGKEGLARTNTAVGLQERMNQELLAITKAVIKEQKALEKGIGDSGKEISDFNKKIQETLERLKNLKDASINTAGGIGELIKVLAKGGTGLDKFNGIAQQMLNMGKVGLNREFIDYVTSLDQKSQKAFISINNGVVKLTKDGRLLNKALNKISIGDLSKSFKTQIKNTTAQIIAFNKLRAAGFSVAEALEAVANAEFALALATSKNINKTKELIKQYQEFLRIQKEFEALDPQVAINETAELLDLQEEAIRLEFEPQIEDAQDAVDDAQDVVEDIQEEIDAIQLSIETDRRNIEINYDRPIEALQREANILSNELSLLDRAASDINERYDKQAEALTKISEINQDIIAQEKSRISLADALTKGDISAAAQAMQELRSAQASARQNSATDALQRSRENEINNLRSSSGMTRDQIEDRQFAIAQETFKLEQDKLVLLDEIRIKEDEIYKIQTTRLRKAETAVKDAQKAVKELETKYKDALKPIKEQRLELEKIKNRIELAEKAGITFEDQMIKIKDLMGKVKSDWDSIKSKEVTLKCIKEGCDCGEHSGSEGGDSKKKPPVDPKEKPKVDVKKTLDEDTKSKDTDKKELNTEPLFTDAKDRNPEAFMGTKPLTISWWNQEQAMIKRAQEAKAAADGAVARAKNAVQIANVVKQEAAAASRGGSQPVSNAAKAAAAAAAEAEKKKNAKIANDLIKAQQYRNFAAAQNKNMGGIVQTRANGGLVKGPGTGTSDSIPARLSNGEYVIKASSVKKYGKETLDAINSGSSKVIPKYPMGGLIPYKDGGPVDELKRMQDRLDKGGLGPKAKENLLKNIAKEKSELQKETVSDYKKSSGYSAIGSMPNPFAMGIEWFGDTLTNAMKSVTKTVLGFDLAKPLSKQSGLEKLAMATALIPGSSGVKSASKAKDLASPLEKLLTKPFDTSKIKEASTFSNMPGIGSTKNLQEFLSSRIFHGGVLPKKLSKDNRGWFGGSLFATDSPSVASLYGLAQKTTDEAAGLYEIFLKNADLNPTNVLDLRHNANSIISQNRPAYDALVSAVEEGPNKLWPHLETLTEAQWQEFIRAVILEGKPGKALTESYSRIGILKDFNIAKVLEEAGIKAIVNRGGWHQMPTPRGRFDLRNVNPLKDRGFDILTSLDPSGIAHNMISSLKNLPFRRNGGYIKGYGMGGPTDDSILARISNGEYIMSADSVKKIGVGFMDRLNDGSLNLPKYATGAAVRLPAKQPPPPQMMNMGGKVKYMPMGGLVPYMNMGGIFKPKGTDTVPAMLTPGEFVIRKYAVKDFGLDKLKAINDGTYNDGSVYNYNLNLNVKSESNPDQIAETVIAQIKRIDGQRIRGNRQ
jgi:TP901 family phage tail tape measure protein